MYWLFATVIAFALITLLTIKRSRRKKYQELQFQNLHFNLRGHPTYAPRLPDFTPVRLKVDNMFATVEAPSKSLKRVHYTLPR